MPAINELQDFTTQVRRGMNRMAHAVQSAHPGVIRLCRISNRTLSRNNGLFH